MSTSDKQTTEQVNYLKDRLQNFIKVVDELDPENIDLKDIDSLIDMLNEMEEKCQEIKE